MQWHPCKHLDLIIVQDTGGHPLRWEPVYMYTVYPHNGYSGARRHALFDEAWTTLD